MPSSRSGHGGALPSAAPIFAALGDRTRLKIVARLCGEGPLSIARLTDGGSITRQAVTKHLRALERAGLAQSSRIGRERLWKLRARRLADARRYLEEIAAGWDAAIDRLRSHVELKDE
jgi:DNA-binding transcriptional ArsR family regulator